MRHVNLLSILLSISLFGGCSDNGPNRFERDSGAVAIPDAPIVAPDSTPVQCTSPQEAGSDLTNQGAACSATAPCQDVTFSYCYAATGDTGYCTTTGCTCVQDCPGQYYCDRTLTPSVCRRPPTGEGTPCAAPADCAAFEASYCETMVSKSCLVSGCSPALNNCDSTHLCCDFASYGLPSLCVDKVASGGVCR